MGLPDLPPEWGTIIIPDDAAALAKEAAQVRRELRAEGRRRLMGSPPVRASVVIMMVAVIVTVVSLAAVTTGPGAQHPSLWSSGLPRATSDPARTDSALTDSALTDVQLRGASGEPIPLGTLIPALVVLADGCACPELLVELAGALPAGVRLVAVGAEAPCSSSGNLRCLADPAAELATRFPPTTLTRPVAIAITRSAKSAPLPGVDSTEDLAPLLGVFTAPSAAAQ